MEKVLWPMLQSWCLSDRYMFFFAFQTIDNLLRCGICFDYFNIAMIIPQCSHNCKYILLLCISKNVMLHSVPLMPKGSIRIYFSPLAHLEIFRRSFPPSPSWILKFWQGCYIFYCVLWIFLMPFVTFMAIKILVMLYGSSFAKYF